MDKPLPSERVRILNSCPARDDGEYVLYAMRSAQRVTDNPALALAALRANEFGSPLVVAFCLQFDFPEANLRHFHFMLEGLDETFASLRRLGAHPVLVQGSWPEQMERLSRAARELVVDRGYLRLHRLDRDTLAARVTCRIFEVEGEAVVPLEIASTKAEYAARTLRPRIRRQLTPFLQRTTLHPVQNTELRSNLDSLDGGLCDPAAFLRDHPVDRTVLPVSHHFKGGPSQAEKRLESFLDERLPSYAEQRNQPQTDFTSCLSPYLHYGMISPVHLALSVQEAACTTDAGAESYLEELIVRRGLGQNFCHFVDNYDQWECIPQWARQTLQAHRSDPRPVLYARDDFESASTHDPYWNAAQTEMLETGYMHTMMRMYWGKKILEWSASAEEAYQTTLYLNNKYFLDGRDPVSFANVGWLFGLHDRPWPERPIYGTVRCMMASGLERKVDPKAYVKKVERLRSGGRG